MSITIINEEVTAGYTVCGFAGKFEQNGDVYRSALGTHLQLKGRFVEAAAFYVRIDGDLGGFIHLVDVKMFEHPVVSGVRYATIVNYDPLNKKFYIFLGEIAGFSVEGKHYDAEPYSRWDIQFENGKWVTKRHS